ncbi:hypothetical protein MVEN_00719900 [Mycena venus]|uniref:Uncharacterized protein n=1 Tax=Mycena venus TaxID=2733690 RepID=A0A8H7D3A5_9AGAR|nr:hypothetical protein MVEN_00719900 [Mycena venus]
MPRIDKELMWNGIEVKESTVYSQVTLAMPTILFPVPDIRNNHGASQFPRFSELPKQSERMLHGPTACWLDRWHSWRHSLVFQEDFYCNL